MKPSRTYPCWGYAVFVARFAGAPPVLVVSGRYRSHASAIRGAAKYVVNMQSLVVGEPFLFYAPPFDRKEHTDALRKLLSVQVVGP